MVRKALLKDGEAFVALEESDFDAERELQEALKNNPEVIPVGDLELGEVVVVGREVPLPVGAIDLLLVDAQGRVIIVETKLSRNPDLRRKVVAQVLDYGASLWKTLPTLKMFGEAVLRYWKSEACEDARVKGAQSLREGVEPWFTEMCGEDWEYDTFATALEGNLVNGQHVFLVVATGLMDGLLRDLLQYANVCLDLPVFGVDIAMFKMAGKELIVPRGVRHTAEAKRGLSRSVVHTDRAAFLEACTSVAAPFFSRLLDEAEGRGLIVYWGTKGFSVRMPFDPPVTVAYGFPPNMFQVYPRNWPIGKERETEFRSQLHGRAPFTLSGQYTSTLLLDENNEQHALDALAFLWDEVHKMMEEAHSADQDVEGCDT